MNFIFGSYHDIILWAPPGQVATVRGALQLLQELARKLATSGLAAGELPIGEAPVPSPAAAALPLHTESWVRVRVRVEIMGSQNVWNRRGISAGSYYDRSHYLHPHPCDQSLHAALWRSELPPPVSQTRSFLCQHIIRCGRGRPTPTLGWAGSKTRGSRIPWPPRGCWRMRSRRATPGWCCPEARTMSSSRAGR
jgi:hypothetical protein